MPTWQELRDRIGEEQLSPMQLWKAAKEAHATDDFSNLLGNSLGKRVVELMQGWTPQFDAFCYVDSVNKLKQTVNRVLISEVRDLWEKPEGAEIRHDSLTDNVYTIQAKTYATGFRFTRETIINDDTGELKNGLPNRMVRAAKRTLEKQVAYKLTSNGTAYDSSAVFVDRSSGARACNNLGSTALARTLAGAEAVATGCQALQLAKDIGGRSILGYQPRMLVVPVGLGPVAGVVCGNDVIANTTEASATTVLANPAKYYGLRPIVWTYLTDYDTNNWYIFCDPREVGSASCLIVSFLNGETAPKVLTKKVLYENNGIDAYGNPACDYEFDVIYDFGVDYGDPCTAYGSVVSGGAGTGIYGTS